MAADPTATPVVGPEQAALLQRAVSVWVAGRDAALRPQLMKAAACRLSDDRRQVTVFLPRGPSEALLDALQANGQAAIVFSEPSTHCALQLKGRDAHAVPLQPGDLDQVQRHIELQVVELSGMGWPPDMIRGWLEGLTHDLVAVRFTPEVAFDQTPGPGAGAAVSPQP